MPSVPLVKASSPASRPVESRPESPLSPSAKAQGKSQAKSQSPAGVREGDDFTAIADEAEPGLVREFVDFLRENRKWWLAPIVAVLLLIGMVMLFGGTAAAPFIYTLF